MVYAINPDKGERWTPGSLPASKYYVRCQYTGLKDKNGSGDICIYEGDVISSNGEILGNAYEKKYLLEGKTNLLIEGLGTKNWRATEEEALDRGLGYPQ